jgi:hypothetical protein
MKKLLLIPMMVCIVLTSCSGQNSSPTFLPPVTPTIIATATSIPTKTPLPTISPTATITPLPIYNTKQVIFDYNVAGGLSDYYMFFEPTFLRSYPKIILYSDGQMIIPGEIYRQKVLSSSEIKLFLSRLDGLGFYSLESNQAYDPTDKLYNFEGKYEEVGVIDGLEYCILVNSNKSRKLCVQESYLQFLIPKMKNILQYLDKYKPAGMTPYYPDRILVSVQNGRHLYDENSPATAVPWNEKFPSLETLDQKITYVDGDVAKEIYTLFDNVYEPKIFIQNGQEFTVSLSIILPHEKVTNAYQ